MFFCRAKFCRKSLPLSAIIAMAVIFAGTPRSIAHDDLAWRMLGAGVSSRAEWFESLKTQEGKSCCNHRDCHQTRAAWNVRTQTWWAVVNRRWTSIPNDRVLRTPPSIDGNA